MRLAFQIENVTGVSKMGGVVITHITGSSFNPIIGKK
jgi:hypothetical protein